MSVLVFSLIVVGFGFMFWNGFRPVGRRTYFEFMWPAFLGMALIVTGCVLSVLLRVGMR